MIPGILICLVTVAGLYSLARFVMQPYIERVKAEAKALKEGIIAHAVVLDIKPTGQYINDFAKVRMQMKVQPYIGRNFVAEAEEMVTPVELRHLRTGSFLKVRYNPNNQYCSALIPNMET